MEHDDGCPGCDYERRRAINSVGVRVTDYRTFCKKCGAEVVGEFEHRVNGRDYCPQCVPE